MTRATFRFYEELNDFLPAERRRQSFTCECARGATVERMIEALGIPMSNWCSKMVSRWASSG